MEIKFKEWLNESFRDGRLGLLPPQSDWLGQQGPLYAAARVPDFLVYYNIAYPNGIPMKSPGIVAPDHHKHRTKNLLQKHKQS